MDDYMAALKTALRVLTAASESRDPDPADVDELRRLAPPLDYLPAEELACDVIKQAIHRRAASREQENAAGNNHQGTTKLV
jgi:hypothetical protein